jgi:hypothetical protein
MTTQGAIVFPVATGGMIEASAIRGFSTPYMLRWLSTNDIGSRPIFVVEVWCQTVEMPLRTKFQSSEGFDDAGITSRLTNG